MYGFWKNKRIVLFDTLISQTTTKEIVAVLAHELGTDKLALPFKYSHSHQSITHYSQVLLKYSHSHQSITHNQKIQGHWKMWHTIQGLVISQLVSFSLFYSYSIVKDNMDMYSSFGYHFETTSAIPHAVGISLFLTTLWQPVNQVLQFVLTLNTRKNEFQADAFAVKLGYAEKLSSALVKLQIENLSNMNPDSLYSAYHYSHPPLVERLAAINVGIKKAA